MTSYDALKVTDLKDLIKERGIASTGLKLKQQLIDALIADDNKNSGESAIEEIEGAGEEVSEAKQADIDTAGVVGQDGGAENAGDGEENEVGNSDATPVEAPAEGNGVVVIDDTEHTQKRKRRSPTPPSGQESVSKKLKTTEGNAVVRDDPVTEPDEDVEVKEDNERDEMEASPDVPTSTHPATRALYIRDLVRPLQPNNLREHLQSIAVRPQSPPTADLIDSFHLDKLRTHAFVLFKSESAATRVRSVLHEKVWPDEPMRKPLFVDYVPEEKVQEWIETETERPDVRWEVIYKSSGADNEDTVSAILQEAPPASSQRQANTSNSTPTGPRALGHSTGEGMPSAHPAPRRQSSSPPAQDHSSMRPPQEERPAQSKSFDTLDSRFSFTETKPKIYFQPVAPELADSRLDGLERETSRDWDDRQADPSLYGEGELRRYTFEDGDRLVDGGADFGLFGRRSTRGRGGGGGGPPRGGRGRSGDFYRGGGGGRW
jgi:hypothetical protein